MFRSVTTLAVTATAAIGAPTTALAMPGPAGDVSSDPSITQPAGIPGRILSLITTLDQAADNAAAQTDQPTVKAQPKPKLTRYQRELHAARLDYRVTYHTAKRKLGVHALGRNIGRFGVIEHGDVRDATAAELRESDARMEAMIAPAPVAAAASSGGAPNATLAGIAQCESGGNPAAVSPDGRYRGKYQFDQSTWESAGGSGDPAAAPESVQDQVAANLMAQRGTSPWGCAR